MGRWSSVAAKCGLALIAVTLALLARWVLDPLLEGSFPLITMFGAVAAAVWLGGYRLALLVAAIGYLGCAYFFFQERGTIGLSGYRNLVAFVAYSITCSIIIGFGEAFRISQRRFAEQAERLRTTLASIGDAVITTNTQGRVTNLNPVAESLTGWPTKEALGQPLDVVFNIVNEQSRNRVENPATRALREGVIVGLANHTVLIAKDSTERPIDDSAAPIRCKVGEIVGCVLVFRDVTERRKAELKIRESEARKSAILDTALDCIISMDHNGKIVDFNPAAEATFGYRRDDVIGQEMANLIVPPDLREAHRSGLARLLTTGESRIIGKRLHLAGIRSDGQQFPVELAVTQIAGANPPMFTGYLRDITERQKAQEVERRLAAIVESSEDAIISKSLDGIIQSWNVGAGRLFGYTSDEAIGRHISFLIPADRHHEEEQIIARLAAGERVDHFDTIRVRNDGQLVQVSLTISPIKDEAGRVIGASKIVRDITQRKQSEQALREADRRKTEFLATLAHELRNPLAPLRNAVQLIRLPETDWPSVAATSEMMERQINQMVRLVDDLLDLSRINLGRIELRKRNVELASVVTHAVEIARPLIQLMQHELISTVPDKPIFLNADSTRLAQVLGNLLNNACKFTEKGGRIWLSVETGSGNRGLPVAIVRVRDSGIGIPADQISQVFEMFMQVDTSLHRSTGGLGIGLTLVKSLVELHGGTIEVHSDGAGKGSEFVIRLPIAVSESQTEPPTSISGQATMGKSTARRILVVDDNRDAAESLAKLLTIAGHETHTVFDGQEALSAVDTFKPDVILLDIGLPKLSGYDVARRIRAQASGDCITLVALTGWGQDEDRQKSKESGIDFHLVKPVDPLALLTLLAEISGE